MVRINTPYQQEQPQLFLKNASIPPIADLSFHNNTVLSNAGLPSNKPIKDKSHNYTNRFVQLLNAFTNIYYFFFKIHSRRHNLPESPPDSEPPYSPADGVGQSPRKTILFNFILLSLAIILFPKTVAFSGCFWFLDRRTPNLQCLISANKGQIPMNPGTTGLYQKQPVTTKIPHPLSVQPLLINQPGSSSHVTHLGWYSLIII